MNRFGYIADDLTSMEMALEAMLDVPHAKALKAALQRAFVEACKAGRAQRLAEEQAKISTAKSGERFTRSAVNGETSASAH